jgi:LPXTG-site transpeptidase (sortase) family protein
MKWLYKSLGRLFILGGFIFACIATVGLLWRTEGMMAPSQLFDTLLSQVFHFNDDPFEMFEPDEMVYDYTLSQNVPRIYYLSIAQIGLNAPVVRVSERDIQMEGETVRQMYVPHAFAVGWNENSAPVGVSGNTVFVGHNNIYGEVFKDLWNLQAGDDITVQTASGDRHYLVSRVLTFEENTTSLQEQVKNASWIMPTPYEQLTLVTCFPYSSNTHRLIIVAHPN